MGIASNLLTPQLRQSKALKWFLPYTKKVEEKLPSSTFPHGKKWRIYSRQLKFNCENWRSLLPFKSLQHNQIYNTHRFRGTSKILNPIERKDNAFFISYLAFTIQNQLVYLKRTLNRHEYSIEKYGFPMYD